MGDLPQLQGGFKKVPKDQICSEDIDQLIEMARYVYVLMYFKILRFSFSTINHKNTKKKIIRKFL